MKSPWFDPARGSSSEAEMEPADSSPSLVLLSEVWGKPRVESSSEESDPEDSAEFSTTASFMEGTNHANLNQSLLMALLIQNGTYLTR